MRHQYHTHLKPQSQLEPLDERQVKNEEGGYVYPVDHWALLRRFLVLGTTGGTFYVGERDLTKANVESIKQCIAENGSRVVDEVYKVSVEGLAPSNDPALFTLAMVISLGDTVAKRRAAGALAHVARTPTHLFHFVEYATSFRGWGRVLKDAVAGWYKNKPIGQLALHLLKYQSRDGWSHRDLLRLTHPKVEGDRLQLLGFAAGKIERPTLSNEDAARLFVGRELAATYTREGEWNHAARVTVDYRLPRELLPTEALNRPEVWSALVEDMPLWALVRNLGNLAKHNISDARIIAKLTSPEVIARSRMHPLAVMTAMAAYSAGRSRYGEWTPDRQIINALEVTLREAIKADKDTAHEGKILVAVDISGSMDAPSTMSEHFRCAELGGALACLLANSNNADVIAYDTSIHSLPSELVFTASPFLWAKAFGRMAHGGTNCALPVQFAAEAARHGDKYVGILNLTDNMSWAGQHHAHQVLGELRRKTQTPVRYVNVQMAMNPYSVADPNDPLVLETVGFDTSALPAIKEFLFGKI